jgi:hypothetical protein
MGKTDGRYPLPNASALNTLLGALNLQVVLHRKDIRNAIGAQTCDVFAGFAVNQASATFPLFAMM